MPLKRLRTTGLEDREKDYWAKERKRTMDKRGRKREKNMIKQRYGEIKKKSKATAVEKKGNRKKRETKRKICKQTKTQTLESKKRKEEKMRTKEVTELMKGNFTACLNPTTNRLPSCY